ncbi:unnamed protein product [Closterium sp. Naga37s-1]|nr:unnamed protein product [Closterium sp. Naga37s-1]
MCVCRVLSCSHCPSPEVISPPLQCSGASFELTQQSPLTAPRRLCSAVCSGASFELTQQSPLTAPRRLCSAVCSGASFELTQQSPLTAPRRLCSAVCSGASFELTQQSPLTAPRRLCSAVVFFINHRYDGFPLWQLRGVPGMHEFVWALAFVSFFFLYPSTFNLLEVAAVDKPKLHMWETGVMRITRHPQMTGQLLWCVAHMLWVGSSFTAVTSLGLLAHHLFGVWHGDQRLEKKYGDAFDEVHKRTSIVPFAAILDGRQQLPADYYKEFLRVPYLAITAMTVGAYFCHPLMIQASFWLHW